MNLLFSPSQGKNNNRNKLRKEVIRIKVDLMSFDQLAHLAHPGAAGAGGEQTSNFEALLAGILAENRPDQGKEPPEETACGLLTPPFHQVGESLNPTENEQAMIAGIGAAAEHFTSANQTQKQNIHWDLDLRRPFFADLQPHIDLAAAVAVALAPLDLPETAAGLTEAGFHEQVARRLQEGLGFPQTSGAPLDIFINSPVQAELLDRKGLAITSAAQAQTGSKAAEPVPAAAVTGVSEKAARLEAAGFSEQIMQQLQDRLLTVHEASRTSSELCLCLEPPQLGELRLKLNIGEERRAVIMAAEVPDVREFLNGRMEELRQLFRQYNLSLELLSPPDGQQPAVQPEAAAANLPEAAVPEEGALSEQIMRQLRDRLLTIRSAGEFPSVTRLRLGTPELGEIRIRVFSGEAFRPAAIFAETPELQELLQKNFSEIKRVFQLCNLSLERLAPAGEGPERIPVSLTAKSQSAAPAVDPAITTAALPITDAAVSLSEGAVKELNVKEQIMQQIQGRLLYIREKGSAPSEMRLRLHPAELGEMTIRVFSRQGKLSAVILVEVAAVKEILEGKLSELRQRFQQCNLPLEQLDVFTAGRDEQGSGNFSSEHFLNEQEWLERSGLGSGTRDSPLSQTLNDVNREGCMIDYWA